MGHKTRGKMEGCLSIVTFFAFFSQKKEVCLRDGLSKSNCSPLSQSNVHWIKLSYK